jgi:hypothetical protein
VPHWSAHRGAGRPPRPTRLLIITTDHTITGMRTEFHPAPASHSGEVGAVRRRPRTLNEGRQRVHVCRAPSARTMALHAAPGHSQNGAKMYGLSAPMTLSHTVRAVSGTCLQRPAPGTHMGSLPAVGPPARTYESDDSSNHRCALRTAHQKKNPWNAHCGGHVQSLVLSRRSPRMTRVCHGNRSNRSTSQSGNESATRAMRTTSPLVTNWPASPAALM